MTEKFVEGPSRKTTTEKDSESAYSCSAVTYGIRKREYCYEEGPSRGACRISRTSPALELTRNAESFPLGVFVSPRFSRDSLFWRLSLR